MASAADRQKFGESFYYGNYDGLKKRQWNMVLDKVKKIYLEATASEALFFGLYIMA